MKRINLLAFKIAALVFILALLTQSAFAAEGLTKIADNIYSYVDTKKMSPQNSFGANAGIIIGKDGILVVDTLISAKEAKRFIRDIRAITDKPIKYVVNTHYHLDHTWGNSEFEKMGAIIISHSVDKERLQKTGEATLKNAQMYGLTAQDLEGTSIASPSITFDGNMEIDLGNQKVALLFKQASHTEGSILVFIPDKKVLFTGDILFTGYHPYMGDGDMGGWTKTLDDIMKMDAVTIIPGHGPISGKKDIAEMKDYLIAFDRKAKELRAKSSDFNYIFTEMKKSLPHRAEGENLIAANLKMRYLSSTDAK